MQKTLSTSPVRRRGQQHMSSASWFFPFLWPSHTAHGILVPLPGIEPAPLRWKRVV